MWRLDRCRILPRVYGSNPNKSFLADEAVCGCNGNESIRWSGGDREARWVWESDPVVCPIRTDEDQKIAAVGYEGRSMPRVATDDDLIVGCERTGDDSQIDIVVPGIQITAMLIASRNADVRWRIDGEMVRS